MKETDPEEILKKLEEETDELFNICDKHCDKLDRFMHKIKNNDDIKGPSEEELKNVKKLF